MGVNKVILVGNVGKDPEIQYVKEDVPVARFTLATSETYKNRDGEKVTTTEWHNIVIWRGLAKVVEQYVKKGSQLYLEGKITTRSYEKDGVTKYFTEVVANNMQMLGGKPESQGGQNTTTSNNTTPEKANVPVNNETANDSSFEDSESDDLPF